MISLSYSVLRPYTLALALALACTLAGIAHAETARRKVIIDDEGFTLTHILLLEAEDVEVVGITTSSGNVWANRATALALRGLEITGHDDVPVAAGAKFPLLNSEALTDRWEALYGKLTWKGAWMKAWVESTVQSTPPYHAPDDPVNLALGNPTTKPLDEPAASFMIRMVRKYPGEITILAGGPLTNLALAQRLDPAFAGLAKELVYMGGSFNPQQRLDNRSAKEFAREFASSPRREFNVRFDPEAASIVSRSPWRKITVVPVDPSTVTQLTPSLIAQLAKGARPEVATLIRSFEPGFPMWDEIAAAVWLDQGIVTTKQTLFVDYNSQFGAGYGDTLSWTAGYQPGLGEQSAEVVQTIDAARMERLMIRVLEHGASRK